MPPTRSKAKLKEELPASMSAGIQTNGSDGQPPAKETVVSAPIVDTPTTSPTFQAPSKTPPRRILRLKCTKCNDYPDGFRSEHELRRHTNRIHCKTRKVWMTIDTSPDKTFLANCKSCQTGKRYNECYNAASHLRRMHFHPHKRGERKMSAVEARRGGKLGDLDPPMETLKANWLREVEEVVGEGGEEIPDDDDQSDSAHDRPQSATLSAPETRRPDGRAPPSPTTPSIKSMSINNLVD